MFKLLPRMPRLLSQMIGCWLILIVLMSVARIYGSYHGELGCINYTDPLGKPGILDLTTGSAFVRVASSYPGIAFDPFHVYTIGSPNNQYTALIEPTNQQSYISNLSIKLNAWNQQPKLILDNIQLDSLAEDDIQLDNSDSRDYHWSPDSRWLAFTWQSTNGSHYLSITDPEGSSLLSVPIAASVDEIVNLFGWSSDGRYLALASWNSQTYEQEIMIWSAPDLKLIKTMTQKNEIEQREFGGNDDGIFYGPDFIQWSPTQNTLAYLVNSEGALSVHLLSVDPYQNIHEALSDSTIDRDTNAFLWSPDGNALALSTLSKASDSLLQLYIFRIDNAKFQKIADHIPPMKFDIMFSFTEPLVFWSADSKMLFYGHRNPTDQYDDLHADLLDFVLSTDKTILIHPNSDFTTTRTNNGYIVTTWFDNDKRYIAFSNHRIVEYPLDVRLSQPESDQENQSGWSITYQQTSVGNVFAPDLAMSDHGDRDLSLFHNLNQWNLKLSGTYLAGIIDQNLILMNLDENIIATIPLAAELNRPTLLSISASGKYAVLLSPAAGQDHQMITILGFDGHITRQFEVSSHQDQSHWLVMGQDIPDRVMNPYNGIIRDLGPFQNSLVQDIKLTGDYLTDIIGQNLIMMNLDSGIATNIPLALIEPALVSIATQQKYVVLVSAAASPDHQRITTLGFDGHLIQQFEVKTAKFEYTTITHCDGNN